MRLFDVTVVVVGYTLIYCLQYTVVCHNVDHSTLLTEDQMRKYYFAWTEHARSTVILDRHKRTREEFLLHADHRAIPCGWHLLLDCAILVDGNQPWCYMHARVNSIPRVDNAMDHARILVNQCRALGFTRVLVHKPGVELIKDVRMYQYSRFENDIDVE